MKEITKDFQNYDNSSLTLELVGHSVTKVYGLLDLKAKNRLE